MLPQLLKRSNDLDLDGSRHWKSKGQTSMMEDRVGVCFFHL